MTKKKINPPKMETGFAISSEALRAANELIAEALRQQTPLLNINIADVTYDGAPIGSYEVSVRRVD